MFRRHLKFTTHYCSNLIIILFIFTTLSPYNYAIRFFYCSVLAILLPRNKRRRSIQKLLSPWLLSNYRCNHVTCNGKLLKTNSEHFYYNKTTYLAQHSLFPFYKIQWEKVNLNPHQEISIQFTIYLNLFK